MSSALILCLWLLLLILVLTPVLYFAFFSPGAVKRRELTKLAREDYRSARGTIHLRLLRDAHKRLSNERRQCLKQLTVANSRLTSLKRDQQKELINVLARHLAQNHLFEVPGIGPALQKRILSEVFRGKLTDLHNAYQVQGVGQNRQWAVSEWVRDYEKRLPALIKTDFPGKEGVVARYKGPLDELDARIRGLTARQADLEQQMARLEPEIAKLEVVTEADFVKALKDPTNASDELDGYLRGVFAAWEPIPDWFKDIVLAEGD